MEAEEIDILQAIVKIEREIRLVRYWLSEAGKQLDINDEISDIKQGLDAIADIKKRLHRLLSLEEKAANEA